MEEWKDIQGYEGLYQVSNYGRVKSLGNEKKRNDKILKAQTKKNMYKQIGLHKDGIEKKYLIHRLVAQAFIPNPNNYKEVNHKDENPSNNNVFNIEWCSSSYNANYGTRKERIGKARINYFYYKKVASCCRGLLIKKEL